MRPPARKASSNGGPGRGPTELSAVDARPTPVAPRVTPVAPRVTPVAPRVTPVAPRVTPVAPRVTPVAPRMTPSNGVASAEGSLALESASDDTELQDRFFKSGLSHDVLAAETERGHDEDVL